MECVRDFSIQKLRVERRTAADAGRTAAAAADAAESRRTIDVFPDESIAVWMVRISQAFQMTSVPYLWKAARPLGFKVAATTWRDYHHDPLRAARAAGAAGAAAAAAVPELRFDLDERVRTGMVYAIFPEDIPELRGNPHYFPDLSRILPKPAAIAADDAILREYYASGASATAAGCIYTDATYAAALPGPADIRGGSVDLAAIFDRLHTNDDSTPFLQYVHRENQILYKLAANHRIPPAILGTWTHPEKLPAVATIVGYTPFKARSGQTLYSKWVLTETALSIIHHYPTREGVDVAALLAQSEAVSARLQRVLRQKLHFKMTQIRLKFAIRGRSDAIARAASEARPIFHVIQYSKSGALDLLFKRAANYERQDTAAFVAAKLKLGISAEEAAAELAGLGESAAAISDAIQRARALLVSPSAASDAQKLVETGPSLQVADAGDGVHLKCVVNNADSIEDAQLCVFYATRLVQRAAAAAAAPAPAVPGPGPSRQQQRAPSPPPLPPQRRSRSASTQSTPSDDLSFLEGGATPAELRRPGGAGKNAHNFIGPLQAADPDLFLNAPRYASQCSASPFKQPIVVSPAEKAAIDREGYAAGYDSAIEYGSSPARRNVYMCPRIWCDVSRRPLTFEQYQRSGCPRGEEPLLLYKNALWENSPEKEHHISFHKDLSNNGLCLPCCGVRRVKDAKLAQCRGARLLAGPSGQPEAPPRSGSASGPSAPVRKGKEERNLLSHRGAILQGRYGTVPETIHDAIFPDLDYSICAAALSTSQMCAVRHGVGQDKPDTWTESILYLLGLPDKRAFLRLVEKRLDPLTFMSLEDGRVLTAFLPETAIVPETLRTAEKTRLQRWLDGFPEYVRMFGLKDVVAEGGWRLSRECAIYAAWRDFVDYLRGSAGVKNPYLFYDMIRKLFDVELVLWERRGTEEAVLRCGGATAGAGAAGFGMLLHDPKANGGDDSWVPIELRNTSGHTVLWRTLPEAAKRALNRCGAAAADAGRAAADGGPVLARLRGLGQWATATLMQPAGFAFTTAILSPDGRVRRLQCRNGLTIVVPEIPLGQLPNLLRELAIRNVVYHEDMHAAATTRGTIRALPQDLATWTTKCTRDLGFDVETGPVIPAPHPTIPLIRQDSRSEMHRTLDAEDAAARKWYQIRRMVARQAILHYETWIAPVIQRWRRRREWSAILFQTFSNALPDLERRQVHAALEILPIFSKSALVDWYNRLDSDARWGFFDTAVRQDRSRSEWRFSQAAVSEGLPASVVYSGQIRPRPRRVPESDVLLGAATAAADAAAPAAALPAAIRETTPASFSVKWTELKGPYQTMRILRPRGTTEAGRQRAQFDELAAWFADQWAVVRPGARDIDYSYYRYVVAALRDPASAAAVLDDPAFRAYILAKAGRAANLPKSQIYEKVIARRDAATLEAWVREYAAVEAAPPNDLHYWILAHYLDASFLVILDRSRHTKTSDKRGGIEHQLASSSFYNRLGGSGAAAAAAADERPLAVFYRETATAGDHLVFSVVEVAPGTYYYPRLKDAPAEILALIRAHTAAAAAAASGDA